MELRVYECDENSLNFTLSKCQWHNALFQRPELNVHWVHNAHGWLVWLHACDVRTNTMSDGRLNFRDAPREAEQIQHYVEIFREWLATRISISGMNKNCLYGNRAWTTAYFSWNVQSFYLHCKNRRESKHFSTQLKCYFVHQIWLFRHYHIYWTCLVRIKWVHHLSID